MTKKGISKAMRRWSAASAIIVLGVLPLAGCATGDDQAVHGGSFTFVSPGGQRDISYPVDEREKIGTLAGPDLMTSEKISIDDYAGKVVAINFWGSWCPPCREEQDSLSLISTELADDGVQFLGIDVRENGGQAAGQDFHRAYDVPYPSIYDATMRTLLSLRGYPAAAIPSMVVLDRQHRVAQIWLASADVPVGEMKSTIAAIAAEDSDAQAAGGAK